MEHKAKQFLKKISESVASLTDKHISQVSYSPKEQEWRAYIAQGKPHWEDIAWRIKEPNNNGKSEFHLSIYSAKPGQSFSEAIEKIDNLSKGKVNKLIKYEKGISLIWEFNLDQEKHLRDLYEAVNLLLASFMDIALNAVVNNNIAHNEEFVQDSVSGDWFFEPLDTIHSFLNWLHSFEVPAEDFDYVKAYEAVYANQSELFDGRLEYWDSIFEEVLQEKGQVLGGYLMQTITDDEKEELYNDHDWDRDWQGLLDSRIEHTTWGREQGGPPISSYFIHGWENDEQRRIAFELFIEACKKFHKQKEYN